MIALILTGKVVATICAFALGWLCFEGLAEAAGREDEDLLMVRLDTLVTACALLCAAGVMVIWWAIWV